MLSETDLHAIERLTAAITRLADNQDTLLELQKELLDRMRGNAH